jgi:hypothetical protein
MTVTIQNSSQVPVQTVSTTKLDSFSTSSVTFIDVPGLSATITPTNSTNKILVTVSLVAGADMWAASGIFVNLVRNSTSLCVGNETNSTPGEESTSALTHYAANETDSFLVFSPLIINFLDSPNTTLATTYKVQISQLQPVVATVGRRALDSNFGFSSTITVTEISTS